MTEKKSRVEENEQKGILVLSFSNPNLTYANTMKVIKKIYMLKSKIEYCSKTHHAQRVTEHLWNYFENKQLYRYTKLKASKVFSIQI